MDYKDPAPHLRATGNENVDKSAFSERKVERRPQGPPKSKKSFGEVAEKKKKPSNGPKAMADKGQIAGTDAKASIFDLSAAGGKTGAIGEGEEAGLLVGVTGKQPGEPPVAQKKAGEEHVVENRPTVKGQINVENQPTVKGQTSTEEQPVSTPIQQKAGEVVAQAMDEKKAAPGGPAGQKPVANAPKTIPQAPIPQITADLTVEEQKALGIYSEGKPVADQGTGKEAERVLPAAVTDASMAAVAVQPTAPTERPQGLSRAQMQELVDQIISKIYTLESAGKMDTTVTLKHPPMFEGVTVKISSYASAKGEVNIAFENLTQSAKGVLDLPMNTEALKQALDAKGVTMHILTTSTEEARTARADSGRPAEQGKRETAAEDQEQPRDQQNRQQG